MIYIVLLKILESYYLQFEQAEQSDTPRHHHTSSSLYLTKFIPLALEFYKNHANSSDLILVNSLIRHLSVYFPNLSHSRFLVTKEQHIEHFN